MTLHICIQKKPEEIQYHMITCDCSISTIQPSQTFPPKTHTTHKPSIFIRASRPPQWRHPCRPVFEAWHLGQSHAVSWQIGLKTHRIHGYDIFTYIWLIFTVYVGKYIQIYHTWILWERIRMYIYTPLKLT